MRRLLVALAVRARRARRQRGAAIGNRRAAPRSPPQPRLRRPRRRIASARSPPPPPRRRRRPRRGPARMGVMSGGSSLVRNPSGRRSWASTGRRSASVSTACTAGARAHGCVDAADAGMGMRAAHEGRLQHAGRAQVVDETAGAGEQRPVFDPRDGFADRAALLHAVPLVLVLGRGGMLGAGEARTFLTRDVCRSLGRVGKRAPLP